MFHRCLGVLLVFGVVAGAGGCAGESSGSGGTAHKVGFLPQTTKANYAVEMTEGFRSGVQAVDGVEGVVAVTESLDPQAQLNDFQKMVDGSFTAIGVHTAAGDQFARPMAAAAERGIPVVAVDNRPPPSSNVRLYVGNDNYALGRQLADTVLDRLPADATGTIVIGSPTPGIYTLDQRGDGIRDRIHERLPGVKVSGPFETKRDPQVNRKAWTTIVRSYPRALAFLGTGNFDAVSLGSLRVAAKASWLAGAFDLEQRALASARTGDVVLLSPEHFLKGAIAGRLMGRYAKDGTALPQGWLVVPGLVVTTANVDTIIARQVSPATKYAAIQSMLDKLVTDPASLRPLQ